MYHEDGGQDGTGSSLWAECAVESSECVYDHGLMRTRQAASSFLNIEMTKYQNNHFSPFGIEVTRWRR